MKYYKTFEQIVTNSININKPINREKQRLNNREKQRLNNNYFLKTTRFHIWASQDKYVQKLA